ncbi:MAG TPA: TspO/MBR family protein [Blastocatellia bacterium]|nr:TspO/MBR family protein [Blastocatellia bacterium]
MSMTRELVGLAVSIGVCLAVAAIGSALTLPSIGTWYASLNKPSWNPPNWVFGPVWSTLYLSMAVAVWLVWRNRGFSVGLVPLTLFAVQLVLNCAWSGLFFGLRQPWWAFAEIVLLWCAILSTIISFARVSSVASVILLPYLAWVTFAAVLNFTVAKMNS